MSAKNEKKRRWQVTHDEPIMTASAGSARSALQSDELDDIPPITMLYCRAKIQELFPLDTPGTKEQKAKRMYERHPFIARAYRDGLRIGRDLRERAHRGLGWEWPSLVELEPKERTYVMGLVKRAIGVEQ